MRIAYIITRADDVGGGQVHVRDLAADLLEAGHEVMVFAGGSGRFFTQLEERQIPHCSIPNMAMPISPRKDVQALLEIVSELRNFKPGIVAAHSAKAGMLGRCAGALLGIPTVFTPHGWSISDRISRQKGMVFSFLERLASNVSARIINVCEYELSLALKYRVADPAKLTVVHNGLADMGESFCADVSRNPARLVMIARFAKPKDHLVLLQALSHLQNQPWEMDLVGDGPDEEKVRRHAYELGINSRVRFLGYRNDPAAVLREAQIFVLTSRSEAFPYGILEAMRAGLPVIASDVGGIREAVVNGSNGLLVEAGNVHELQHHLEQLIADPALRKEYGDNGRRRFLNSFAFDVMFRKTMQVYQEVLETASAKEGRSLPVHWHG